MVAKTNLFQAILMAFVFIACLGGLLIGLAKLIWQIYKKSR